MSRDISQALARWLDDDFRQIGEIAIEPQGENFELRHYRDVGRDDLKTHTDARALATCDDAGNFRPLKSAPTLRRGWSLVLAGIGELHSALDVFYPAMLGTLLSHERGELFSILLRETLARQSGMYAVTKKITDEQADAMIGDLCKSDGGCLKTILWRIAPDRAVTSLPPEKFDPTATQPPGAARTIPLLCSEACNLLVAKAREVVKRAQA